MTKFMTGSFFFVVLTTFSGFFMGMLLSRFLIPKDPGMLGGILVLGNGVIGMVIGLLLGIISWRFLNASQLNVLNRIMGIFCLGFTLWLGYRIMITMSSTSEGSRSEISQTKEPTEVPATVPLVESASKAEYEVSIGLGMGRPIMEADRVIYFYDQGVAENPLDSLIFRQGPYHLILDEPSSRVSPEIMKLDYQLCYFLAKRETPDMLEVVINKQYGGTAWVKKESMDFLPWPFFLTMVHSVEAKDWTSNPVRISPEEEASAIEGITENHIFQAKVASGDWLSVEIFDEDYEPQGKGWIRWRKDGKLLLDYNLLS